MGYCNKNFYFLIKNSYKYFYFLMKNNLYLFLYKKLLKLLFFQKNYNYYNFFVFFKKIVVFQKVLSIAKFLHWSKISFIFFFFKYFQKIKHFRIPIVMTNFSSLFRSLKKKFQKNYQNIMFYKVFYINFPYCFSSFLLIFKTKLRFLKQENFIKNFTYFDETYKYKLLTIFCKKFNHFWCTQNFQLKGCFSNYLLWSKKNIGHFLYNRWPIKTLFLGKNNFLFQNIHLLFICQPFSYILYQEIFNWTNFKLTPFYFWNRADYFNFTHYLSFYSFLCYFYYF